MIDYLLKFFNDFFFILKQDHGSNSKFLTFQQYTQFYVAYHN